MKIKLLLSALLIQGFFILLSAQNITPIIELHKNNSSGVPNLLDQTVKVTGVVTSANEIGNPGYMQDATGGVAIYDTDFTNNVSIGDSVTLTGKVAQYKGLTELKDITGLENHGSAGVVEPQVLTISELLAGNVCSGTELYEGNLIKIEGASFSETGNFAGNTNYDVTDASGTVKIRISSSSNIVGSAIPEDEVDVIGVVGQYSNSNCDGYQIFPRTNEDVSTTGGSGGTPTAVPIIELHKNTSEGVPTLMGQNVTVSGVVTVANQIGGPAYVEDPTGGVAVYDHTFSGGVTVGDSVTFTAKVTQYNGLTELTEVSELVNHGQVTPLAPEVVTISEMLAAMDCNGTELYEGNLIRINAVSVSGSGNFEGDTNYDITDGTASVKIRIATETNITGTPIPGGQIDIIGVVGQYSFTGCEGYQIFPRYVNDIIGGAGPTILSPVYASNITENSFTVYFNTNDPGNTEIKWGKTTELELGSETIDEEVTQHEITISGLDPITKYYYKVLSTNSTGTSESSISYVITASDNPSAGQINAYFNYPVDHTVAIPGNEANGNADFPSLLINRINNATYSIDIAFYSFFGLENVEQAIVAAKNRGVKVRVVYDQRNMQSGMQALLNSGIDMSQRPDNNGLMHNKFAIFDGRDENNTNDWIWTGSWNWTSNELDWRNNILEINDPSIAIAYTTEFEEMWGGSGDTPNTSSARFGNDKIDNTVHNFNVGGREVKLYFSPSDNTEDQIEDAVLSADTSVYFAVLAFTSDPISEAIQTVYGAGATDVRGIIDDANNQGSEFSTLDPIAEVFDYNLGGKLHHKYGLVDPSYFYSNPTVVTGSHNWSASANNDNDENTLIIEDIYLANQYMQEFKKRYNELGGTTSFVVPVISSVEEKGLYPENITLNQNYPNPFNPVTTITFFMPEMQKVELSVYNVLGQKVASIYNGYASPGLNVFDFDASELSSGVYIYRLSTENSVQAKKLTLLK